MKTKTFHAFNYRRRLYKMKNDQMVKCRKQNTSSATATWSTANINHSSCCGSLSTANTTHSYCPVSSAATATSSAAILNHSSYLWIRQYKIIKRNQYHYNSDGELPCSIWPLLFNSILCANALKQFAFSSLPATLALTGLMIGLFLTTELVGSWE